MDLINDDKLTALLSDNKSGSHEILLNLNRWLKENIDSLHQTEFPIQKIRTSLAHFQTVDAYLIKLSDLLKKNKKHDVLDFIDNTEFDLNSVHQRIFENGKTHFKNVNCVITISNSYSVGQFLINLHARSKLSEVVVCESRPVNEGKVMAEKILDDEIPVRFVTEASICQNLDSVNAAVIGADKILKNGSVINKIGSRQLAILCNYFNIPFYVIADKSKFSATNDFYQQEMPKSEIWDLNNKNLNIHNFYFEPVEKSLITKVISD